MTVLVTGGAGYIGSALVPALLEEGHTVRVMDNMFRERYCSLESFDRCEFYDGDVRSEDDVRACLKDVDTVYSLADITDAAKSFDRKELTNEVNFGGEKTLFTLAQEADVQTYIYASTTSVYGNTPRCVDESYDCEPVSPYGASKLRAEQHVLDQSENMDMAAVALRLGTVHGYSPGIRFDTVINYFTYLASQGKPLTVHESARDEYRPYVNVHDVVAALRFAAANPDMLEGTAYNVVAENLKMAAVLERFTDCFPAIDLRYIENPTENKASYRVSSDKLAGRGFEPDHTLQDGINAVKQRLEHLQPVA